MLVLSRKQDESILIGKDVEVVVLGVRNGRVRLGIKAPREVPVHRGEVAQSIAESRDSRDDDMGTLEVDASDFSVPEAAASGIAVDRRARKTGAAGMASISG